MKTIFFLMFFTILIGNSIAQNEDKQIYKTYTYNETELIFFNDSTFVYKGGDISSPHFGKYKLIENVGYIISSIKNETSLLKGLADSIFECNNNNSFFLKILLPNLDEQNKKKLCYNYLILFENITNNSAKQIIDILETKNSDITWKTSQYDDDTIFLLKTLSYNPEIQVAESNLLKVKEIRYSINYNFTKLIFSYATQIYRDEKCLYIEIPNLTTKYVQNIQNDYFTNELIEIVDNYRINFRNNIYFEKNYFNKYIKIK